MQEEEPGSCRRGSQGRGKRSQGRGSLRADVVHLGREKETYVIPFRRHKSTHGENTVHSPQWAGVPPCRISIQQIRPEALLQDQLVT